MTARIQKHKDDRGPRWQAIEEEIAIERIVKEHDTPDTAILIDCATLWLNNLIYHAFSNSRPCQKPSEGHGSVPRAYCYRFK